jgi:hypothetical protein
MSPVLVDHARNRLGWDAVQTGQHGKRQSGPIQFVTVRKGDVHKPVCNQPNRKRWLDWNCQIHREVMEMQTRISPTQLQSYAINEEIAPPTSNYSSHLLP